MISVIQSQSKFHILTRYQPVPRICSALVNPTFILHTNSFYKISLSIHVDLWRVISQTRAVVGVVIRKMPDLLLDAGSN